MAHSFCRHLSNTLRFTQTFGRLEYSPCCHIDLNRPVTDRQSLLEGQKSLVSEAETNLEQHCKICFATERAKNRPRSLRQRSFDAIPETAKDLVPYILEIQIDVSCNAACVTCGPHYSTLWQKQLGQYQSKTYELKTQSLYDRLPELVDFSEIREVRFFGGEPFINNLHLQVLSYVPDPSQVEVFYSTNGSVRPTQEEFETLKKFKKIRVQFSIDDIGERFTYIRWPLKWSMVEQNLIYFYHHMPNVEIRIHSTINPLNSYYVPELQAWSANLEKQHGVRIIQHTLNPCYGPWGIDATPPGLRDFLYDRHDPDHPLIRILNEYKETPDKFRELENNMNWIDQERGVDWKSCFPDVVKYFIT